MWPGTGRSRRCRAAERTIKPPEVLVPAQPFVDLSTIDLTEIAVTPEQVGEINPQLGDMRHLDHIIHVNTDAGFAVGVKHVRHDEFWVPLHIPGRPLMPGVLMIEAAAQLSSVFYHFRSKPDTFVGFTRCDDTIFRAQVVPGDTLYLLIREVSFSVRRMISECQGVVDGKLVFETKITGMTL
jgi:3-hydroxyacyl-[acyl-carrier-protein] dehydratase